MTLNNIQIRAISADEVRPVIVLIKQFEQASKFAQVDVNYTTEVYKRGIKNGLMTVLVMEEDENLIGSMAFLVAPALTEDILMGVELFWFMHPDHRKHGLKLFDKFEWLAIEQGCKKLAMIHMTDSYPEKLEKLYKRRGYELVEKHYIKEAVK